MTTIDFWYDLASPYSYLAAMRIDDLARDKAIHISWRPFLLGGLLKEKGLGGAHAPENSAKLCYIKRDVERLCNEHGLPYLAPEAFPQNSLLASRVLLTPQVAPQRAAVTRHIFDHHFGRGGSITTMETLASLLAEIGFEPEAVLEEATSQP